MRRILVISRNYQLTLNWLKNKNINPYDVQIITHPEQLQGYQNPQVIWIGAFTRQYASNNMLNELAIIGAKVAYPNW